MMRNTTLLSAILLLSAVAPATMAADDDENLRERNRDILLDGYDGEIPEDATATLMTDAGTETMPATDAIDAMLDHLDQAQINLQALFDDGEGPPATPALAGEESFPLAGTSGAIVEGGSGPGFELPPGWTCDNVKRHEIGSGTLSTLDPVFDQPKDGFVTSSLSEFVPNSEATMIDEETSTLSDSVSDYSDTILAGPNHRTLCLEIQMCFFGFCFHSLFHTTTLSTGVVTDGEAAQLVHDEAPIP